MNSKKRVFSASRPTGQLHIGNLFGALKGYVELQNSGAYDCIYMAVDLHAVTTPYDRNTLANSTRDVVLDYLAVGLDPEKSIITVQSLVPEHTYLAFLFSSLVSIARMQHLPTFKDKIRQYPHHVTMALLNYPILMAADILAYKAELVPVGLDQEPHLEVAREIARKLNADYNLNMPLPQRFAAQAETVPGLTGEGKMSKTIEGSAIMLTDPLDTIREKLAKVPTDSGQGESVPTTGGVATLLELVRLFEGEDRKNQYVQDYVSSGIRYKKLKEELTQAVFTMLQPIQERRQAFAADAHAVDTLMYKGAEKAREITVGVVRDITKKMGFLQPSRK